WTGDHTDGQRAQGACDAGNDGSATGTGAAAFASGDEDHVGAAQDVFDLLDVVLGCLTADLWVGACAQSASQFTSNIQLDVGIAHEQSLSVGIDGDEFNALQTDFDHTIDCVYTATADSDDFNDREVVLWSCHVPLPLLDVLHESDPNRNLHP